MLVMHRLRAKRRAEGAQKVKIILKTDEKNEKTQR